eukprot:GEMP01087639.1.p1 GENE.GEMP01087639.1~~GEMP01087639.1.p1  ORF type:complete len:174 (+),score=44.87 GEMP01087639.1:37-558(+)
MEDADAEYYAGVDQAMAKAMAKAIPRLWAAKAKAYAKAKAKAAMPPGPPPPLQAMQERLEQANVHPKHQSVRDRAHAAPAKAKAKAVAAGPGGHPLYAQDVANVINRVENLATACYKATFPLRAAIKRQRDGEPITKIDAANSLDIIVTHADHFDATFDAIIENFLDNNNNNL